MKTIYPLVALLSAASVAAGPLPQFRRLDTRTSVQARTEHLGEAAPVPAPAPAPMPEAAQAADAQRLADEKAGKEDSVMFNKITFLTR